MHKLASKRPREWSSPELNDDETLPFYSSPRFNPLKRIKTDNGMGSPQSHQAMGPSVSPFSPRTESAFPPPPVLDEGLVNQSIQGAIDRRPTQMLQQSHVSLPAELAGHTFTFDQVKAIVTRIVAERESQIRAEYDHILCERLQDQFRSFSKFNEDCISRQFKHSDFSYLS